MKRNHRLCALAMSVVAALAVAAPSAAHASVSQGRIAGEGAIDDDLFDEGTLSRTSHPNSNATGVLQMILWSQDLLPASGVDCQFGPNTEAAVKALQRRLNDLTNAGLVVDGKAGPATFRAFNNLRDFDLSGASILLTGWGGRSITDGMLRRSNGTWQYQVPGAWVDATYAARSTPCNPRYF